MSNFSIIIMAAGKGTRMQSSQAKVLTKTIAEKTLIEHVLANAAALNPKEIIVVVGHQATEVQKHCESLEIYKAQSIKFALQAEQLGTGHAVQTALPFVSVDSQQILILSGDVPLVKPETLQALLNTLNIAAAQISLISMEAPMGSSYGRIIREDNGKIIAVREKRDCSAAELLIKECNSSIYACNKDFLSSALSSLKNENSQSEYYLTDIIAVAANKNLGISNILIEDALEVQGVNTLSDLAVINQKIKSDAIFSLMQRGIIFSDPESCRISPLVNFEGNALIGSNIELQGNTFVGNNVCFHGNACIKNCQIEANAKIKHFVVCEDSTIGAAAEIGPFAHLRPGSKIGAEAKVGNFVETKNALLHSGVKASHLSYLGDCEIGEKTNIGAGTIFANYDGKNKHQTKVGKNCFIGSNSTLVAPVEIGDKATIGAGSVIRKSIAAGCLALTRGVLRVIEGWRK